MVGSEIPLIRVMRVSSPIQQVRTAPRRRPAALCGESWNVQQDIFTHLVERFTRMFGPPRSHALPAEPASWTGPGMEIQLRSRQDIPVVEIRGADAGRGTASRLQFTEVRSVAQANIVLEYLRELARERGGVTRLAGRNADARIFRRGRDHLPADSESIRVHRDLHDR